MYWGCWLKGISRLSLDSPSSWVKTGGGVIGRGGGWGRGAGRGQHATTDLQQEQLSWSAAAMTQGGSGGLQATAVRWRCMWHAHSCEIRIDKDVITMALVINPLSRPQRL